MGKFKYGISLLICVLLWNIGTAQKSDRAKSSQLYDEIVAMKSSYNPLNLNLKKIDQPSPLPQSDAYI